MKTAVVTGAFGFAGANLVECLLSHGFKVYCVGRKKPTLEAGSGLSHNDRFAESDSLKKIYLEMEEFDRICDHVEEDIDYFFHLAWGGQRDDFVAQSKNIQGALKAMESAKSMNCKRFVGIGSQAEYGLKSDLEEISEDMKADPFTAYGSCKAAAFYLLKNRAKSYNMEFVWGRIFSLIGKYEPEGRMLPDLVHKICRGERVSLSSCEQYWDYLDAEDAAEAIFAIATDGVSGEDYNIAGGNYRILKDFVKEAVSILGGDYSLIEFGNRACPFVSLKPSVQKIMRDTRWKPVNSFEYSVRRYLQ